MKKKLTKKIAVFRALQLGDMLCSVPAFRALRAGYPDAQITLIGLPWAKEFVSRFGKYIDNFIAFPGFPGFPEQSYDVQKAVAFIHRMQKDSFDLVIQMHGSGLLSNYLISLFNAKKTAGFYKKGYRCPNHTSFFVYNDSLSEVDRLLSLLELLGLPVESNKLEFPISETEKKRLVSLPLFKKIVHKPFVCLHPGARDSKRRWDPAKFAYIADKLAAKGYAIAFTGTEDEVPLIDTIGFWMKYPFVSFAGKLSLGETATLLQHAMLLVTNCTGISHIADALAIPSIIIFRDSDPSRWAPKDTYLHKRIYSDTSENVQFVLDQAIQLLDHSLPDRAGLQSPKEGGIYV